MGNVGENYVSMRNRVLYISDQSIGLKKYNRIIYCFTGCENLEIGVILKNNLELTNMSIAMERVNYFKNKGLKLHLFEDISDIKRVYPDFANLIFVIDFRFLFSRLFMELIFNIQINGGKYVLFENKYLNSHYRLLSRSKSKKVIFKRSFLNILGSLIGLILPPHKVFVNTKKALFNPKIIIPKKKDIIFINDRDTDIMIEKGVSRVKEIVFIDSNVFANKDFNPRIVQKHIYLKTLKADLQWLSYKTNMSFRLALHPKANLDDYLPYFSEKQLFIWNQQPVIPDVLVGEGSTLFETLSPLSGVVITYVFGYHVKHYKHRDWVNHTFYLHKIYKTHLWKSNSKNLDVSFINSQNLQSESGEVYLPSNREIIYSVIGDKN